MPGTLESRVVIVDVDSRSLAAIGPWPWPRAQLARLVDTLEHVHFFSRSLVARDMTERELREAQQRRHQDELAHTARLVTLGELASGIAHEINQPLAAVITSSTRPLNRLRSLSSWP